MLHGGPVKDIERQNVKGRLIHGVRMNFTVRGRARVARSCCLELITVTQAPVAGQSAKPVPVLSGRKTSPNVAAQGAGLPIGRAREKPRRAEGWNPV